MKLLGTRKTPIGALLYVTFIDSGLRLPEFIAMIGYTNIPQGIRTFQSFVNTGTGNPIFLERLQASRLAINSESFLDALSQTDEQLRLEQDEERLNSEREKASTFRPACYAVPSLDPGAHITIYAVTRDFEKNVIQLPASIGSWSHEAQYRYLQRKIRGHYRENEGRIRLLGAIISYLYYRNWSEPPLALTIDGQPLGVAPQRTLATMDLRPGNRPIRRELFTRFLTQADTKTAQTKDKEVNQSDYRD